MITIFIANDWLDFKVRRYNTNSFDEAAIMLVDDWRAGKIEWEFEEITNAFTAEWLEAKGYPVDYMEPKIDRENEFVHHRWHWHGETEGDDVLIYGYFFKTTPVQEDEWPTLGVDTMMFGSTDWIGGE